jgi:membrane protein YdbS with pleckstrin-like domain
MNRIVNLKHLAATLRRHSATIAVSLMVAVAVFIMAIAAGETGILATIAVTTALLLAGVVYFIIVRLVLAYLAWLKAMSKVKVSHDE